MNKKFKEFKEQKKKKRIYTLTQEQLDNMKKDFVEEACQKAQEEILVLFLSIPVKIAKEHYRFSRKKLENFCNFIIEEYESLNLNEVNLEECKELLYEECGMRFELN